MLLYVRVHEASILCTQLLMLVNIYSSLEMEKKTKMTRPVAEVTKIILMKVEDFCQVASHNRGSF